MLKFYLFMLLIVLGPCVGAIMKLHASGVLTRGHLYEEEPIFTCSGVSIRERTFD